MNPPPSPAPINDSPRAGSGADVVLRAHGICKTFPGVKALDNAQITVRFGRLVALLGENGAGKSTLMNILAGVFPPDAGRIELGGEPVSFRNPREAQLAGISIIFQELNLVQQLSVAENIFLGREPRNRLGLIDYRTMCDDARRLLKTLELDIDPRTKVSRLRVGAQQVVEIAKALSFDARVLIMDEPTSAISEHEIQTLFRLIRQLKQRGMGIIYITHKLDELAHIADDITVMRDGRFVDSRPYHGTSHDDIIRMMVGRDRSDDFAKAAASGGAAVLQVRGLSLRHPQRPGDYVLRDVSFEVAQGEVVGIFGLMGAGRTELLQTIFGLHPRMSAGTVTVDEKTCRIRSPLAAIHAGIALAPEDRKAEGLVLPMSVAANISLASLDRATQLGWLRLSRERGMASEYRDRLAVKTPSLGTTVRNLSGGNQQKVVLAKWLATKPKVLLLDEPTRGIDVNAKREIYRIVGELAEGGMGVVVVSSELPEILTIADRILVLSEGRLTGEFPRDSATEDDILRAALPKITTAELATA